MKQTIFNLVLFIVGITAAVLFFNNTKDKAIDIDAEMAKHVGDTIIIEGDTSVIVDYSLLNDTYTLYNGKVINKSLVK